MQGVPQNTCISLNHVQRWYLSKQIKNRMTNSSSQEEGNLQTSRVAQPHKKRPIFKHGLHLIRRVKHNICQEIITKKKVQKVTSLRLSQILNQNIKKHKSKFPSKLFLKKFRKLSRTTHQITTP